MRHSDFSFSNCFYILTPLVYSFILCFASCWVFSCHVIARCSFLGCCTHQTPFLVECSYAFRAIFLSQDAMRVTSVCFSFESCKLIELNMTWLNHNNSDPVLRWTRVRVLLSVNSFVAKELGLHEKPRGSDSGYPSAKGSETKAIRLEDEVMKH